MEERQEEDVALVDLGDAMVETKQCTPFGVFYDSWFQYGSHEYQGGHPPQC